MCTFLFNNIMIDIFLHVILNDCIECAMLSKLSSYCLPHFTTENKIVMKVQYINHVHRIVLEMKYLYQGI